MHTLSWLAGYLEGEGTFLAPPPSMPNNRRVRVSAIDADVVQIVADFFGTKMLHTPPRRANWSATYEAVTAGRNAVRWMETLYPYMGIRRQGQIAKALGYVPDCDVVELDTVQWLAGLLEGEGSFMKGPPSRPNRVRFALQMRDYDVVEQVSSFFGVVVKGPYQPKNKNAKPYYTMVQRGKKAAAFMQEIYPLMGERRQTQIDDALTTFEYR